MAGGVASHRPPRGAAPRRPGGRAARRRPAVASRAAPGPSRGRALPGRRDATRALVRFGGANPERTAHEHLSRSDTRQHERPGQDVRDGTGRQRPGARVRVHTEEVTGSIPDHPRKWPIRLFVPEGGGLQTTRRVRVVPRRCCWACGASCCWPCQSATVCPSRAGAKPGQGGHDAAVVVARRGSPSCRRSRRCASPPRPG